MSCPRLPARNPFGETLNSLKAHPGPGASIDGEDRVLPSLRRSRGAWKRFEPSVRRRAWSKPASGDRRKESRRTIRVNRIARRGVCNRRVLCFLETRRPEMSTVDRTEKKEAVATLHDVFSKTSVVVVAHYSGLT